MFPVRRHTLPADVFYPCAVFKDIKRLQHVLFLGDGDDTAVTIWESFGVGEGKTTRPFFTRRNLPDPPPEIEMLITVVPKKELATPGSSFPPPIPAGSMSLLSRPAAAASTASGVKTRDLVDASSSSVSVPSFVPIEVASSHTDTSAFVCPSTLSASLLSAAPSLITLSTSTLTEVCGLLATQESVNPHLPSSVPTVESGSGSQADQECSFSPPRFSGSACFLYQFSIQHFILGNAMPKKRLGRSENKMLPLLERR